MRLNRARTLLLDVLAGEDGGTEFGVCGAHFVEFAAPTQIAKIAKVSRATVVKACAELPAACYR